jgi:multisubunit Na+/H+ antiporter MnhG subunit
MKVILTIVGVLLLLLGIVWFLQGINVLPGSFMSGQIQFAIAGIVAASVGTGLIVYSRRQKGAPPAEEEKAQDAEIEPKEGESG